MKILFDHQIFGWQKYGGISRYIYETALQIEKKRPSEVSVVCPFYVNQYLKNAPVFLKVFGLPIKQIRRIGRILSAVNWLIAWPIIRFLQPSIVHETYYSSKRIAPKGAKVVLTVYDMIHERFSDQFSILDSTTKDKAIAVERADHVICISEQTRQDLIDLFGVNPVKTSVVYLGFSLTCSPNDIYEINNERPFFLYVGARGGYKNFERLLKAYADSSILSNNFDLICFGGGAFSGKEIDMMQQLNIKSVRQVSGADDLLAGFYSAASAFVYPSLYEGFGIPPLEAMSFDCPVVCSNVSSIPEVVGEAGLMFDPYDTQSVKVALEKVVSDVALREELILLGRERIKEFSWERCAQETLEIYRKVLS